MSSLLERVVSILSEVPKSPIPLPARPPVPLAGSKTTLIVRGIDHYRLYDVRGEQVVRWNLKKRVIRGRPPQVLEINEAEEAELVTFLEGVTSEELALTSSERPVAVLRESKRLPSLPFDTLAIVHPSLDKPVDRFTHELGQHCYWALPCFDCEVADEMDPAWARLQLAHMGWSVTNREARPACRFRKMKPPSKRASKPLPFEPLVKPTYAYSNLRLDRRVEIQNFRGRVLRSDGGNVSIPPDGEARSVVGENDAKNIVWTFLTKDELPEPGPLDPIGTIAPHDNLEAVAGEKVGQVEPVEFFERINGHVVLECGVQVHESEARMTAHYRVRDERLKDRAALISEIFRHYYLWRLTNQYYRGKVSKVELVSPQGEITTFDYA